MRDSRPRGWRGTPGLHLGCSCAALGAQVQERRDRPLAYPSKSPLSDIPRKSAALRSNRMCGWFCGKICRPTCRKGESDNRWRGLNRRLWRKEGIRAKSQQAPEARVARCLKTARSAKRSGAKFGGERGIRTLGRPLDSVTYRFDCHGRHICQGCRAALHRLHRRPPSLDAPPPDRGHGYFLPEPGAIL